MKISFLIGGLLLFFLSTFSLAQQLDTNIHIYLLMGQSNMAGRGAITPEYKTQQHDRVIMLNKENEWIKAMHPLHFDKPKSAGVGPGLAFGIAMAEAYPNATIALVPCAVGGTSISKWEPGAYDKTTDTHPYDDALDRIKEAQKYGVVKGVIWHQGEADSREKNAEVYLDKLGILIKRIRKECSDPQLPFVAGELGRYKSNYAYINDRLAELEVPNTLVVSSEGLWHKGDNTHFDSPSASELGRRFADGMLRLQHKKTAPSAGKVKTGYNSLSAKEKAEGWELLFDGKNPNTRWRSINGDAFPKEGWVVENEALVLLPGGKGKDIITREQFSDFEFTLEYKLSDSANTGIKYFVSPLKKANGQTVLNGPEFQLIDDFKHESVKDNKSPETSTGSLYLLYAPQNKTLNKPGEWNQIRIIAKGKHVEHWLNGKKIVSYERGSEEFRNLVAKTKFKEYQTPYGEAEWGYFLIQDHNRQAWFRNIKIRRLE